MPSRLVLFPDLERPGLSKLIKLYESYTKVTIELIVTSYKKVRIACETKRRVSMFVKFPLSYPTRDPHVHASRGSNVQPRIRTCPKGYAIARSRGAEW